MHVDIHEAETILSKLIDKANSGEEIIITMDDTEVQLVPKPKPQTKKEFSRFGGMPGIKMKDNFDDPLPNEIAKVFGIVDQK